MVKGHYLRHLSSNCTFPDLSDLFIDVQVDNQLPALLLKMPDLVTRLKEAIVAPKEPDIDIGPHCDEPYECLFKVHCWRKLPSISIFDIPRLRSDRKWELYKKNVISLDGVPTDSLSPKQKRMVDCTTQNSRWIDREGIKEKLDALRYPIAYLDFGTTAPAIPRFIGTRPYSPQIPFQFVLYIEWRDGTVLGPKEFIHCDASDPRLPLIAALIKLFPKDGSVVVYNKGFKASRLKSLANWDATHARQLLGLADRLWDPLTVIENHVYDPEFLGIFNLKKVAPTLLGEEAKYDQTPIRGGLEAQLAYAKMIAPETSQEEAKEIGKDLSKYCGKDNYLMLKLVQWLRHQTTG